MTEGMERAGLAQATARLRARILTVESGVFLGKEDALLAFLETSRATLRQIARILEREGLLEVRRGINGGYYASRPGLETIENVVSGYLHALDVQPDDATMIASVLWIETLRKAAGAPVESRQPVADTFAARLAGLRPDASFPDVLEYEEAFRGAIFDLIGSKYVQLIFQINARFAQMRFDADFVGADASQAEFLRDWRNARYLEIATIASGDPEMAAVAATRARGIWQRRFAFPRERAAVAV